MAKILVADDADLMRKIARMSLEKGGHQVIEASDGAEALSVAKSEKPDIILLDAEMPEMDGWEAAKAIKSLPEMASTPILMCTGHDLSGEEEQLKSVEAAGFISKPYNPATMIEKIKEILGMGD